ncbi:uncharacterized protein LOC124155817 [Ischnura elegans]|uniref:uncharacterized protein LOC124155817 n=1 Tax=Ischnura elegans TaxID=197161 RepID=UPI001ED8B14C|nr:uncharacterized protein LOC124155817 [Ischnura elegans]
MGWLRIVLLFLTCLFLERVNGHGRLIEPPSRGTMWRYGFSTPPDFQDHELFCGGFSRQWQRNGGKCGVCGDPWDAPQPRAHEAGGKYALGIIVRKYKVGSVVPIRVELTANHKGFFEFRLCPQNNHRREATQACLDKHLLTRADSVGGTRVFPGSEGGGGNRIFEVRYCLPVGLTCSQCVLQWRYVAGNNWGTCANGTGAVGCGPQEEFRSCADVSIHTDAGEVDETPYPSDGDEEDTNVDNEIPDGKEEEEESAKSKAGELEKELEGGLFWWAIILIIVGCAFISAVAVFALLYLYYYHARDGLKKWMKKEEGRRTGIAVAVPIEPHHQQAPPAVPPRRTKRAMMQDDLDNNNPDV